MIAVDTNVLLRRLLQDDREQTAKADRLFETAGAILVTDVVLAELVWTLAGKRYGAVREQVVEAITSLLEEPNIHFEDRAAVWSALCAYADAPAVKTANGTRTADFADALIVHKAMAAARALGVTYEGTYTFDRPAQQLAGTRPG